MKLKLDENLGLRVASILIDAGHDVQTVRQEGLAGVADAPLLVHCRAEARALVTLDLEFGNPLRYWPRDYPGIAVLRLPRRATRSDLIAGVQALTAALRADSLERKLWIVERHRVRVYRPESE